MIVVLKWSDRAIFPGPLSLNNSTSAVIPTMLYTATCGADSHPPPHHISVIDIVADSGVCVLPSPNSRTQVI